MGFSRNALVHKHTISNSLAKIILPTSTKSITKILLFLDTIPLVPLCLGEIGNSSEVIAMATEVLPYSKALQVRQEKMDDSAPGRTGSSPFGPSEKYLQR